jgi:hypothetical protein
VTVQGGKEVCGQRRWPETVARDGPETVARDGGSRQFFELIQTVPRADTEWPREPPAAPR